MATDWFLKADVKIGVVLFTISLVISGCERDAPQMPAGLLASREAQADGGATFATHCSICHGVKGDGRGLRREGMNPPPADLTMLPWSEQASIPRVYRAIRYGVAGSAMPPWPTLDDKQIWEVVAYIRSLRVP